MLISLAVQRGECGEMPGRLPIVLSIAGVGCGAWLVACTSLDKELPDRDYIRNQWASSIERLGFSAIYPPNEDVQVGDVYAFPEFCNPESEEAKKAVWPHPVKVASIDLRSQLHNYYGKRLQFEPTPETKGAKFYKQGQSRGGAFRTHHRLNVPLQALPEFELARGSFLRVSAGIPLPFAGLFGTFARRETLEVTIKVPYSETYQLPIYDAVGWFDKFCNGALPDNKRYGRAPCDPRNLFSAVVVGSYQVDKICGVYAGMVNRVFATRSIQYNYQFAEGSAAAGQVVVTLDSAVEKQKAAANLLKATAPSQPVTGANVVVINPPAGQTVTSAAQERDLVLKALLEQVSADLETLKASQAPGGSFSYATYGSTGISLNQDFERPIVIGYTTISTRSLRQPPSAPPGPAPDFTTRGGGFDTSRQPPRAPVGPAPDIPR